MVVIVLDKLRLLIADSDTLFSEHAAMQLTNFPDIEFLGIETTGQDALRKVRSLHPDLLLFDLVLPGLDGISLLRCVNELHNPPATLCCTRFFSDVALEAARNFGASFLVFKPVELTTLHPVIVTCAQMHRKVASLKRSNGSTEADAGALTIKIRNYIVSLGIPSKLIGCSYLTEAVRLAREDASLLRNLSGGIYLEISRILNTTPSRIERCIRSAISAAYTSGGLDMRMNSCPSNKEFINYIIRNIDI